MYRQIKRAVSLGAVMLVTGVPAAAMARPIDQDRAPTFEVATPAPQTVASPPAVHAAQAFHWDDAGLGAAGMLAVVAVGSGAAVAVRRRAILS